MEKLEIIVNEMMADDGPIPMELGNVCAYDAKTAQSDSVMSNDMSHEDVCATARKGYKAGKGAGKKGPNGSGTWHRGKGARAPRATKIIGTATRTRKARATARKRHPMLLPLRRARAGVNFPYKWGNSIDEEDDQVSS